MYMYCICKIGFNGPRGDPSREKLRLFHPAQGRERWKGGDYSPAKGSEQSHTQPREETRSSGTHIIKSGVLLPRCGSKLLSTPGHNILHVVVQRGRSGISGFGLLYPPPPIISLTSFCTRFIISLFPAGSKRRRRLLAAFRAAEFFPLPSFGNLSLARPRVLFCPQLKCIFPPPFFVVSTHFGCI